MINKELAYRLTKMKANKYHTFAEQMTDRKKALGKKAFGKGPNDYDFKYRNTQKSAYFDDPNDLRGFLSVEDASDVVKMNHTGWYADEFQDELYIPVVVSVRGPDRMLPRFYSGYRESMTDGYVLDLRSFTGSTLRTEWRIDSYTGKLAECPLLKNTYTRDSDFEAMAEDAKRQAAYKADTIAERAAERAAEESREYNFKANRESWMDDKKPMFHNHILTHSQFRG